MTDDDHSGWEQRTNHRGQSFAERLNLYSSPRADGGVDIDLDLLTYDLIGVAKLMGFDLDEALAAITRAWDKVEVEVNIPHGAKQ